MPPAHVFHKQLPRPRHDLAALKETLLIPEAWERLGLPPRRGRGPYRSPFRKDNTPSFSIYDEGRRWSDFGTGEGGDVIDFIALACGLDKGEAVRRFLAMVGVADEPSWLDGGSASGLDVPSKSTGPLAHLLEEPPWGNQSRNPSAGENAPQGAAACKTLGQDAQATVLTLPPLHPGSPAELQSVAHSRRLDIEAVSLAHASLRTLVFGEVCGFPCWILTDVAGRIAEARRIDGKPFPCLGNLSERKAHTLKGSHKNWPVGVAVLQKQPHYRAVLLVEGGPDYLAALHFCVRHDVWDVLPIAMLGRSAGTKLDEAALRLLACRRVRIYPHADADGGGVQSARIWSAQLHQHGCEVDTFDFSGLTRRDGRPVKDLNDCTVLHPDAHPSLQTLLP